MSFLPHHTGLGANWLAAAFGSTAVHGAVLWAAIGVMQHSSAWNKDPQTTPDFQITLEQLDANTLVGIHEQIGQIGALPNSGPVVPELPGNGGGNDPDTLPGSTPEDPTPEEPPDLTQSGSENTPDPHNDPGGTPPATIATPDTPVMITGTGSSTGTDPDLSGANPALPAERNDPDQIAMAPPNATQPPLQGTDPQTQTSPPSGRPANQQDFALADLIQRIQSVPAAPCLVALPRRDGESGAGMALIGESSQDMSDFSSKVIEGMAEGLRQSQVLIDPRQCPVLSYVRNNPSYPASQLGIQLDSTTIPSGGRLSGVVRGVADKSILLLVIDANGIVQSLDRFITINGDFARIEVPVTRTGPQRDAAQILLILATQQPANIIQDRLGQLAQDVFAGLKGHPVANAAMAITTFDVR